MPVRNDGFEALLRAYARNESRRRETPRPVWVTSVGAREEMLARCEDLLNRHIQYNTEHLGEWNVSGDIPDMVVNIDPSYTRYSMFFNDPVCSSDDTAQRDIQCADDDAVTKFLQSCVNGGTDAKQ